MGILRKNDINEILELLRNETDTGRAREYEKQLLNGLGGEDKAEMEAVLDGRKLPSLLSDTIAKNIFSADVNKERLEYLLRNVILDNTIEVAGSYTNEIFAQSDASKKVIFDEPAKFADGRHSDTEFQVSLQDYILTRSELYASDMLMFQYSVEKGQKKSELSYRNAKGVVLVVLMRHSPKEFKDFDKTSSRYIHRFTKRAADSGLEFDSMITMVFVQLDKCLKQFKKGINAEKDSSGKPLDELQLLLSMIANINDKAVQEKAKDNNFMMQIISEVKDLSEDKEVRVMLLAEKYIQADINAVKSYERREGREEGIAEGIAACIVISQKYGISKDAIIQDIIQQFDLDAHEAEEYYNDYAK